MYYNRIPVCIAGYCSSSNAVVWLFAPSQEMPTPVHWGPPSMLMLIIQMFTIDIEQYIYGLLKSDQLTFATM